VELSRKHDMPFRLEESGRRGFYIQCFVPKNNRNPASTEVEHLVAHLPNSFLQVRIYLIFSTHVTHLICNACILYYSYFRCEELKMSWLLPRKYFSHVTADVRR